MSGKVWRVLYAPTSNSASRANKPPRQFSAALIRLNWPATGLFQTEFTFSPFSGSRITTAVVLNASAA